MDFDLNKEQQILRDTVRRFANEEILPVAGDNDTNCRFPDGILKKMAPLGLLGGPVPVEYGGAGLDHISHAVVIEEIGKACSSVRTTLSVQISLVELTILKYGSKEQKTRYLPMLCSGEIIGCFALTEPGAGSNPAGMSCSAVKTAGGWLLNGVKTWISNGSKAGLAIIFAQSDRSKGYNGINAYLVDMPAEGITANRITGKLGLRSSDTAELVIEDLHLTNSSMLGAAGEGFKIAMSALGNGRYSVAAGCLGIISGSLEYSIQYAREREQFGKKIAGFQLVQDMIARMKVDYDAARYLTYRAGDLKNKNRKNVMETSIAKYFATEAAMRAATDAIQVLGATGYSNEHMVERYFRDAKVSTIYEGTSQIQKLIIAEQLTGIKAFE